MKYLIILGASVFLLGGVGFAQPKEQLRVSASAELEAGQVSETVVLTDADARAFIEVPVGVVAVQKSSQARVSGALLPPIKTNLPAKSPKFRMKELYSFEFLVDGGESLNFLSKFETLNYKNRLRLSILEPDIETGNRPLLLFLLQDDRAQLPKLWRFIDEDTGWARIGGSVKENNGQRVFMAKLPVTGRYTIFDENPIPTSSADDYKIPDTVESLEEQIERLTAKRDELLAEQDFEMSDDVLPPFISDEILQAEDLPDEFFEDYEEQIEIPSLADEPTVPAVENPFPVVPATDPTTSAFIDPINAENAFSQTASAESFVSKEGELPTAGSGEGNNLMLFVLLGVIGLLGGAIYTVVKRPY